MDKSQLQLSLQILFCCSWEFFDTFIVNFAKPYLMYAREKLLLLWPEPLCRATVRLFHKIIVLKYNFVSKPGHTNAFHQYMKSNLSLQPFPFTGNLLFSLQFSHQFPYQSYSAALENHALNYPNTSVSPLTLKSGQKFPGHPEL